jgi:hypothetical protein
VVGIAVTSTGDTGDPVKGVAGAVVVAVIGAEVVGTSITGAAVKGAPVTGILPVGAMTGAAVVFKNVKNTAAVAYSSAKSDESS